MTVEYTPSTISIHALLAESDVPRRGISACHHDFYPRSPCGERREYWVGGYGTANNFYPRSPCGERPQCRQPQPQGLFISIHALLAESDTNHERGASNHRISIHALLAESDTWQRGSRATYVISIHALLAESDLDRWLAGLKGTLFLSTLSLRRATQHESADDMYRYISIHALLAESDHISKTRSKRINRFLSTLSLRRATQTNQT